MTTPTVSPALRQVRFALVGNPNVGKTSLFNALTGLNQRVGNYSGVTVDKKVGKLELGGSTVEIVDLPGIYAISPHSPDEMVAFSVLTGSEYDLPLDGLLVLLDASNLERNLYLFSQVLALGLPTVAILNMLDVARAQGITIDVAGLSRSLGVPVVALNAARQTGLEALHAAIEQAIARPAGAPTPGPALGADVAEARIDLQAWMKARHAEPWGDFMTERLLIDEGGVIEREFLKHFGDAGRTALTVARANAGASPLLAAHEARVRYAWVRERLAGVHTRPRDPITTLSGRIDAVLTHRVFGLVLFFGVITLIFQSIYAWSGPLMDAIEGLFLTLGGFAATHLPDGPLESLVVDGVIAGIGSVVIFLPQIAILFLLISVLEDCGYMARAAFLMDRVMGKAGLSGKSFIPMLSGFACAVPSIMATRTIENRRDRLATIMVIPLMSCSARLPVYTLLIGAFVPAGHWLGLDVRGLVLLAVYSVGAVVAIPVVWFLKRSLLRGETPTILLELPSYKLPSWRVVGMRVFQQSRHFLERAGGTIFVVALVVWALAYFPHNAPAAQRLEARSAAIAAAKGPTSDAEAQRLGAQAAGAYIEDSYLARMGRGVAPAFAPLGWDWRITTGVLASFPAREVIVSTLGTLYSLGGESAGLGEALKNGKRADGSADFTLPVALSVMVFFALCLQCAATLAVMWRETGSWRWPALAFAQQTAFAYLGALVTYQLARLIW